MGGQYMWNYRLYSLILTYPAAAFRSYRLNHITVGAARKGPWAKQICSEISTDPRSIVIRSLVSFTLLKFVCPARFTPFNPRQKYFSRSEMSKVRHCARQSRDSLWIQVVVLSCSTVFFIFFPLCGFPGGGKRNGSLANMQRRASSVITAAVGDLWQDYLWDPVNTINPTGAVSDGLASFRQSPSRAWMELRKKKKSASSMRPCDWQES